MKLQRMVIQKIFGKIESLNLPAFGVGFDIKVQNEAPTNIEKEISKVKRMVVFIDEAQHMKISELSDALSYFYDRHSNISFILFGSEIGIVEQVLGENDPTHPLYGNEKEVKSKNGKAFRKKINPNSFSNALTKLVNHAFIEKNNDRFHIADPIVKKAIYLFNKRS